MEGLQAHCSAGRQFRKIFPIWKSDLKNSRMKFSKNKVQCLYLIRRNLLQKCQVANKETENLQSQESKI